MKTDPFYPFDPVSATAWKQKIQYDLQGADYNKTLIWQSEEGIDVRPFYSAQSEQSAAVPDSRQVGSLHEGPWKVGMRVTEVEMKFPSDVEAVVLRIAERGEIPGMLLRAAMDQECFIHFEFDFLSQEYLSRLTELLVDYPRYALNIDILNRLARTGNWFHSHTEDHVILQFLMQHAQAPYVCSVDTGLFQNAGAHRVQQLAYGLAQAHEYLNFGLQHNLNPKPIVFKISVDGNYFFEIAKLRALRWLWNTLAVEYGIDQPCHILAEPSLRNRNTYDYNTNLLRSTMECLSAIQGGADVVLNRAYDSHFKHPHDFSRRIALNQLRILKHEAYMDQVYNPADGAYYIEALTKQLAEKALALFKEIEKAGGYYKKLKEGTIQRKIKEQSVKQQDAFDSGNDKLVGANAYLNEEERIKDQLDFDPFLKKQARKTEIEPIIGTRLAEKMEKQRLGDE